MPPQGSEPLAAGSPIPDDADVNLVLVELATAAPPGLAAGGAEPADSDSSRAQGGPAAPGASVGDKQMAKPVTVEKDLKPPEQKETEMRDNCARGD